jgi:hypothetical protein
MYELRSGSPDCEVTDSDLDVFHYRHGLGLTLVSCHWGGIALLLAHSTTGFPLFFPQFESFKTQR